MTRAQYISVYQHARLIFIGTTDKNLRRHAQAIAVQIENIVGQIDREPAGAWRP